MPRITIAAKIKQIETDRDHAYLAAEDSKQGWARASEALAQAVAERDELRGVVQELERTLETEQAGIVGLRNQANEAKRQLGEAVAIRDAQGRQIIDLQERLAAALSEGDRMRGYIARVQEDDVVREELVSTEEDGGTTLVPKRRPERFPLPGDHSAVGEADDRFPRRWDGLHEQERPRKPLHWIRYGRI